MVRLGDGCLVWAQDRFRAVRIHMQRPQYEDQAGEGRVRGNGLEPVVVYVEQYHLRLGGLEDEISELLDLEARLEGKLQL